jgi:hypothetical protein
VHYFGFVFLFVSNLVKYLFVCFRVCVKIKIKFKIAKLHYLLGNCHSLRPQRGK